MQELERRFKIKNNNLNSIPKDKVQNKKRIEQVYSNINPDVRIRKMQEDNKKPEYYHTVKYFFDTNNREELEMPISEEQYNNIFNWIDKKPVIKDRYYIDIGDNLIAEVDNFLDSPEIVVEVEFKNTNDMNKFKPKNWFGDEIKDKKSFNKQIFSMINCKDIYEQIKLSESW